MQALLIVNPEASSVTARSRLLIQRALTDQHDVSIVQTERRGHATRLASAAADAGAEAVIVLGGDGTLNEAANGLAGSKTVLGVLPGGSTNVFARTIGITNDPVDATVELLDAMAAGSRRRIGLGKANNRYFLFHVGIGFDAAIIGRVERLSALRRLKRYAGHPLFVWSTLVRLASYGERRSPRVAVTFADGSKVDGYLSICLNSNPYTFLGNRPFNIAPDADFDRGMAVLTVKSLRFPVLGGIVASSLLSRKGLEANRRADLRMLVEGCSVRGYGKFPYQLDGDYLGDVSCLELSHHPELLEVFVPASGATYR